MTKFYPEMSYEEWKRIIQERYTSLYDNATVEHLEKHFPEFWKQFKSDWRREYTRDFPAKPSDSRAVRDR